MRERIKIRIFRIFTNLFEYIFNRYIAFLTHVDTRQLPRQLPVYIEKEHYHIGKKVANVGFVWHPDILFQSNDISVGTSFSCRKYHWAHLFPRPCTGNQSLKQSCIIYLDFFFLADLISLDKILAERTCYFAY